MSDTTGTQGESLHISPEELDQLRQHVSDDGEAVEQVMAGSGDDEHYDESDEDVIVPVEPVMEEVETELVAAQPVPNRPAKSSGKIAKVALASITGLLVVCGGAAFALSGGKSDDSRQQEQVEQGSTAAFAFDDEGRAVGQGVEDAGFRLTDDAGNVVSESEMVATEETEVAQQELEQVAQTNLVTEEDLAVLASAIGQTQDDVAALSAATAKIEGVEASVEALQQTVIGRMSDLDEKISKLTSDIKRVATLTAQAKKANDAKTPVAPTVNGPSPELIAQYKGVAPKKAPQVQVPVAPEPVRVVTIPPSRPVSTRPVAPNPAPEFGNCQSGARISQVWRVSGANQNAAYLFRANDNFSMMVRLGTDVPGFGKVQGIDVASRAVCTTSGLIQR